MLEASVGDIKKGEAPRGRGVVCMRYYPRFLHKQKGREYRRILAPDEPLFRDFRNALARLRDHNRAFEAADYENRFYLSVAGLEELAQWAALARRQDITFFCQCRSGEKCHRHLLLLMAKKFFRTPIARIPFDYPIFERRLGAEAGAPAFL